MLTARIESNAWQRKLESIDETIRLHEIVIDTDLLGATRVQSQPRITRYNAITRSIYSALAAASPRALPIETITASVCMDCGVIPSAQEWHSFERRVRERLKVMSRRGQITRLHAPYGCLGGLWCDNSAAAKLSSLAASGLALDPLQGHMNAVPQAAIQDIRDRLDSDRSPVPSQITHAMEHARAQPRPRARDGRFAS
jgi:hypothetical protein